MFLLLFFCVCLTGSFCSFTHAGSVLATFARFANLDQAAAAKKDLSGQYIGKFQCKIGYGKVNATTKARAWDRL
jgi:hypothetical protein